MKKTTLFILSILLYNITYCQNKKVEVIDIANIDYYNVYKVIEFKTTSNDTLILLGCNDNNKDFTEINLEKGKKYNIETRLYSSVKISEDRYMFCKPSGNILNSTRISIKGSLPILILNAKEIVPEKRKCIFKD